MVPRETIDLACREVLRRHMIRYLSLGCVIFGIILSIFGMALCFTGLPGEGPTPWFGMPIAVSGGVLLVIGAGCLMHPPVSGVRFLTSLFFLLAGMHGMLWLVTLVHAHMLGNFWLVVPLALALQGYLGGRLRARFGDRVQESTPADLRRSMAQVIDGLFQRRAAVTSLELRWMDPSAPLCGRLHTIHGWLSPEGYAILLTLDLPAAFNENAVLTTLKIKGISVVDRADLLLTPTGETRGDRLTVHATLGAAMMPNATTTPDSLQRFTQWKGSA